MTTTETVTTFEAFTHTEYVDPEDVVFPSGVNPPSPLPHRVPRVMIQTVTTTVVDPSTDEGKKFLAEAARK